VDYHSGLRQGRTDDAQTGGALEPAESAVRVVDKDGKLLAAGADLAPLTPLLSVAHKNLEMLV
jgi:hypothetical protein